MSQNTFLTDICTVGSVIYEFKNCGSNAKQVKAGWKGTFYIPRETKTVHFTFLYHNKPHCEVTTVHKEVTTEKRTSTIPFLCPATFGDTLNTFIFLPLIKNIFIFGTYLLEGSGQCLRSLCGLTL